MASDGFFNRRSGTWVSPERAHQHVGESFGGFEKARSTKTGNFYMRPDSGSGSSSSCSSFLSSMTEYQIINNLLDNMLQKQQRDFERKYGPSDVSSFHACLKTLEMGTRILRRDAQESGKVLLHSTLYDIDIEPYLDDRKIRELQQTGDYDPFLTEIHNAICLTSHSFFHDISKALEGEDADQGVRPLQLVCEEVKQVLDDAILFFPATEHAKSLAKEQRNARKALFWRHIHKAQSIVNEYLLEQAALKRECGHFNTALKIYETLCFEAPPDAVGETQEEMHVALLDSQYEKANALQLKGCLEQACEIYRSLGDWRESVAKAEDLTHLISVNKSIRQAACHIRNGDCHSAEQILSYLEGPLPEQAAQLLNSIKKIHSIESSIDFDRRKLHDLAQLVKETRTSVFQEKILLNQPTPSERQKVQLEAELATLSNVLRDTSPFRFMYRSSLKKDIEQKRVELDAVMHMAMDERQQRKKQILNSFLIKRKRFDDLRRQQNALRKDIDNLQRSIDILKRFPLD